MATLVLHHYDASPYAEKVRAMLARVADGVGPVRLHFPRLGHFLREG